MKAGSPPNTAIQEHHRPQLQRATLLGEPSGPTTGCAIQLGAWCVPNRLSAHGFNKLLLGLRPPEQDNITNYPLGTKDEHGRPVLPWGPGRGQASSTRSGDTAAGPAPCKPMEASKS